MKIQIKKILLPLVALMTLVVGSPTNIYALDLVISGNGSDSVSEVVTNVSSETTVEQTNEANVANNVDTDANTGGNTVSNNTGEEQTVNTGAITQEVGVVNEMNVSNVDNDNCCKTNDVNVTISGNGSASTNAADVNAFSGIEVSITNNANVLNSVTGNANTGGNTANNNNGNVQITTGNIKVGMMLSNSPINYYN